MSLSALECRQQFTVLEIMMILHYRCFPERYGKRDPDHAGSPAVRAAHRKLIGLEMIKWKPGTGPADEGYYELTSRAEVYVAKLQSIGLPKPAWGYPDG
jgi:hypothetical protein